MWVWLLILLGTSKTQHSLREVLVWMALIVSVLLPIVLLTDGSHHSRLYGVVYTIGSALLFGVIQFFGPRVRCNLGWMYPNQMKRYEQVEKLALWVLLVVLLGYFVVHFTL